MDDRRFDRLTGALIGLARATEGNEWLISESTDRAVLKGLFATASDSHLDEKEMAELLLLVEEEKKKLVPNCFSCASPCGRNDDYDMQKLWAAEEEIRSLKLQILSEIRQTAVCTYHAAGLNAADESVTKFFYDALFAVGMDGLNREYLHSVLTKAEELRLKCTEQHGIVS